MTPGRLLEIAEQHPPETQEQTSGKAVFGSVPGHTEGQKMPGPLDHQSAVGTNCATECAVRAPESSARGPAADPIADLCAELRATHCSNENLHDNAAYELERLARTERLLRACMRHETARAERAEAERDALRECVKAAIKAMNDECLHYAQYGEQPPQHLLDAIDAARAKVKP